MSFPRYPTYKDSGVEWLGEVPGHWEVTRLKNIASINMGQSPNSDDCTQEEVGLPFLQGNADFGVSNPLPRSYCVVANKLAKVNDILFSVRAPVGAINIADQAYGIGRGLCAITPSSECSMRFVFHALQVMKSELFAVATGSTYEAVSTDQVGNATCLAPPLPEQTQIAAFLDRETAKIDGLVAEQQRLMALLKEKRQAVISHAVTRGLNPDAPMKPSGIEWLGGVPAHWEVVPLKYLCLLLKDGTHLPPERVDVGIPLLSVRNLIDGKFSLRSDDSMISEESYQFLCRAFVPKEEDVLLAIVGATLGKTAVIPDGIGPFHIQRSVAIFRTRQEIIQARFLNLVFQCGPFQALLWEMVGYSAQPGIYLGTLENIRIPVPSVDEQTLMLEAISVAVSELTDLTAEAKRAIDLLQERRTALISAAVTGQIDMRNLQCGANQPVPQGVVCETR